jgi:HrpA-like RNA helicase
MGKLGKMKAEARKQAKGAGKVRNGALHGVKMAYQRLQGQGKAAAPQTTLHGQQQDQPKKKKKKKKNGVASSRPSHTEVLPMAKKGGRQLVVLPVDDVREELVKTVMAHQTTIVVGETGSGKSTRIPSYLERALNSGAGRVLHGGPAEEDSDGGTSSDEDAKKVYRVVCTQPRRVAATTIAERVASERGCRLGGDVGYTVRFDDCSGARTVVKYVTDGILLRESMTDPDLSNYDVVILDEAHERSLQTDVVMGLLKMLQKRRRTLRIVVMSATLDVSIFSEYFMDCGHVNVPGRQFPVDVLYTKEREDDWKEGVLLTCLQIHEEEEPGGVLVFLPGQEDIEDLQQLLDQDLPSVIGRGPRPEVVDGDERDFEVVPLYARMPPEEQRKAFVSPPAGVRKFILATNIAETSVTISGIKYVVDPGYHKTKLLVDDSITGMELLANRPISKSQANQRAGRAGRVSAGKCFRLFTGTVCLSICQDDCLGG